MNLAEELAVKHALGGPIEIKCRDYNELQTITRGLSATESSVAISAVCRSSSISRSRSGLSIKAKNTASSRVGLFTKRETIP